ncbi:hypothetical protein N482_08335 [Pseudoalteromonas luteoviolacea NCIMB 1942]|uniref:Uncharacterized protein n=1 Tax=Pseudoalteromonas luteoviolacea NCIMB 1942 TaxID=1365253 RepID=A0A167D062_9GAMM|nr:hypothetical protein N482_08335 [Pseudoalteromonas luteoviolacea NCIMB 1942]
MSNGEKNGQIDKKSLDKLSSVTLLGDNTRPLIVERYLRRAKLRGSTRITEGQLL